MAARRPLVEVSGGRRQLPSGDTMPKALVDLANVDNTSDAAKPISTATATALAGKEPSITAGTAAQIWHGDKTWQEEINAPVNTMPDSGRFAGKVDPQLYSAAGTFAVPGYFTPFNGAGAWSSAGRFFFDNSTNGGAGSAISTDVQDLLAKMGRSGTNARNGIEFHCAQITAGSGTSSPIGSGYLVTTNGIRAMFGARNYVTFAGWVRAKSGGSVWIGLPYYKNGALVATGTAITIADGWTHVRVVHVKTNGFDTAFPYLGAASGTVLQLALPVFISGIADISLHVGPIPTLNGMNA